MIGWLVSSLIGWLVNSLVDWLDGPLKIWALTLEPTMLTFK